MFLFGIYWLIERMPGIVGYAEPYEVASQVTSCEQNVYQE